MPVKLISLVKRKAGLSREAFIDYYENHHAALGLAHTEMIEYRRNYVDPSDPVIPGDPEGLGFDVITESVFADHAAMRRSVGHCATPPVRALFEVDEAKFVDRAASRVFCVDVRDSELGLRPPTTPLSGPAGG